MFCVSSEDGTCVHVEMCVCVSVCVCVPEPGAILCDWSEESICSVEIVALGLKQNIQMSVC